MSDDPIADLTKARERLVASRRRMAAKFSKGFMDEMILSDDHLAQAISERQKQIESVDHALKDEYNLRTSKRPAGSVSRGGAVRPTGDISDLE